MNNQKEELESKNLDHLGIIAGIRWLFGTCYAKLLNKMPV